MMRVILLRGFSGQLFSTGMDRLSEKIGKEFPEIDVVCDGYEQWFKYYDKIWSGDFVLIGHSFGALACYKIVSLLPTKSFPLVVSFDYSPYYSGLVGHFPDGIVPINVTRALNFYQEVDPLVRGVKMRRVDGTEQNVHNVLTEYAHVEIDKAEDLHQKVIEAIKNL